MRIEFLGTGGAIRTPRPGCVCRVCAEARVKGIPYSRGGPSLFVHGPDVLIDTPEEIKAMLNRSQVKRINACVYSHWHPDHVMGQRVWESRNWDFRGWPPVQECTKLYFPEQVAVDIREKLGTWSHFEYLQAKGIIENVLLADGDNLEIEGVRIHPFRLAETYVYAFLFEGGGKRVLIAPDELNGWDPPEWLRELDLAVIPKGLNEFNPLTGERVLAVDHPALKSEATDLETLEIVRKLGAKRVVMTHIEEPEGLTYDDLGVLEGRLKAEGFDITFAHDTMMVDV
jgi:phosphoribosyl 1,2-cyclic phosphate phosphodiesterase